MASVIFNSFINDLVRGNVNFTGDSFKLMLVDGFVPDVDVHTRRSHVTGEVAADGYTAGGAAVVATVSQDNANNRIDVSFSSPSWGPPVSFSATGAVIYKSRGGAASADELVAFVDFGGTVVSTNGAFTVTFSSPLRVQN